MSATCVTEFALEGQHTQDQRWSVLEIHNTKYAARESARSYRDWNANRKTKGWRDFRVVKVTTTREVLPKK